MNAAELADSAAMFVVVRPKSNLEVLNGDLRRRPPAAARRSEQLPAAWQSWPPCAAPRLWSGGSPLIVAPGWTAARARDLGGHHDQNDRDDRDEPPRPRIEAALDTLLTGNSSRFEVAYLLAPCDLKRSPKAFSHPTML